MYRSPEVEWRGPHISSPIDMWVVGVVVTVMAGVPFTDIRDDLSLPERCNRYFGEPPQELQSNSLGNVAPIPIWPWPAHLVTAVGDLGLLLLDALLTYEPQQRAIAAELIDHSSLHDGLFPLFGVTSDGVMLDGQGLRDGVTDDLLNAKLMLTGQLGQSIFNGLVHDWSLRYWQLQRDPMLWMQRDDIFKEGTPANKLVVQLAAGNEVLTRKGQKPRRHNSIDGSKVRIAGHLGIRTGVMMIGLSIQEACPAICVIDFMKAFLKVNIYWSLTMQSKAKVGAKRLGFARQGQNGKTFLRQSLEEWFLSACEFAFIDAHNAVDGYLVEEKHRDGSMSVFHVGLTFSGARDLICYVPGSGRLCVPNKFGTSTSATSWAPSTRCFIAGARMIACTCRAWVSSR